MNSADLNSQLLGMITSYGAPVLGLVLLAGAMGLPVPSSFLVLAGGALIRQGALDGSLTLLIVLPCVVVGDTLSFIVGRIFRRAMLLRFSSSAAWQRAEAYFRLRGGLAIYLTRCLLTPIAAPVNVIAGSSGYTISRFIRMSAVGQLTWLALYGSLGYLFGSQWQHVSARISSSGGPLAALALALLTVIWLARRFARSPARAPGV